MPDQTYRTILAETEAELIEKRSRFICVLRPVTTEQEAMAFIAGCKSLHRDANHNCSAFILRKSGILRCSDDGEPQGTAGAPMLEVLKREGLTDVAAVVTRYFGGVLLGAGGLVRAYSGNVKLAIDAAEIVTMRLCTSFMLDMPYTSYGKVQSLLAVLGAEILDSGFTTGVTVSARLPSGQIPRMQKELTELSGGTISPLILDEAFAPSKNR